MNNNQTNPEHKRYLMPTGLLILLTATQTPALADRAQLTEAYGTLPLSFEPNQGQTDKQVLLSRGPGYTLFLTPTEAVLSLRGGSRERGKNPPSEKYRNVRIQLIGANPKPQISGFDALPGKVNYFRGNKPIQWRTNIQTYAKVNYENVYPGIDLVYYGNQRQLEHDFVVAPGADPKPSVWLLLAQKTSRLIRKATWF